MMVDSNHDKKADELSERIAHRLFVGFDKFLFERV